MFCGPSGPSPWMSHVQLKCGTEGGTSNLLAVPGLLGKARWHRAPVFLLQGTQGASHSLSASILAFQNSC